MEMAYYIQFKAQRCQKYASHPKKVQMKVVQNRISSSYSQEIPYRSLLKSYPGVIQPEKNFLPFSFKWWTIPTGTIMLMMIIIIIIYRNNSFVCTLTVFADLYNFLTVWRSSALTVHSELCSLVLTVNCCKAEKLLTVEQSCSSF